MSMTFSVPATEPHYEIPEFEALRRIVSRFRRLTPQVDEPTNPRNSGATMLATTLQQCIDLLNEMIPSLSSSIASLDLEPTLDALAEVDESLQEASTDQQHWDELMDQRAKLVQTVRVSMCIASGTFRTAVDELDLQLNELERLSQAKESDRYLSLVSELGQIANAWLTFSHTITELDGPGVTSRRVRKLLCDQMDYLTKLHKAHHDATL